MYSANVLIASISMSLPYFKIGMFGLTNVIPESFSFNDQMFTEPPPPFLTFFMFVIISCAFEADKTPFLHKYHHTPQFVYFFLLKEILNFLEPPI